MIEVILLVAVWAIRFFFNSALMLFLSQKSRMYTKIFSRNPLRLAVSKVSPKMRPIRMKKKT